MRLGTLGVALVTLFLSTQALAAQQPGQPAPRDSMGRGMTMGMDMKDMRMMDSMNLRLDTLMVRMNRATGNAKVTAMAQVLNELVAQRQVMQTHMHQMMRSHGAMMGGSKVEAKPDTSDHAAHHPEK
ncbi:MAG TPA: hypothetical protein VF252_13855 [Gemmatimonadales bacterium]